MSDLTLDTIAEHLHRNVDGLPLDTYWLRLAAILRTAAQYGRQTARSERWQRAVEVALQVEYPEVVGAAPKEGTQP